MELLVNTTEKLLDKLTPKVITLCETLADSSYLPIEGTTSSAVMVTCDCELFSW